jgi:hypothetical protein
MTTNEDDYYFQLGYQWGLKVKKFVRAVVIVGFGGALTGGGAFFLLGVAILLRLPDAELWPQMQGDWRSITDQRTALVILGAFAIAALIWGLRVLYDFWQPRENSEHVATLENQLIEVQQFAEAAEHRADETAQAAVEAEWMRHALACISDVFRIEGVWDAARKAARRALHPDMHPGASPDEISELTARFQHAEEVFSRFQPN